MGHEKHVNMHEFIPSLSGNIKFENIHTNLYVYEDRR